MQALLAGASIASSPTPVMLSPESMRLAFTCLEASRWARNDTRARCATPCHAHVTDRAPGEASTRPSQVDAFGRLAAPRHEPSEA